MGVVKDLARYYTYADYEGWDTSVRCELIDKDSAIQWLLADGKYAEQRYAKDVNGSFVIFIQVLSLSIML
jgi:hypothetical protein